MTINEVEEILKGRFTDQADRQYWEEKKAELERKARNAEENSKYFKKMAVYNR